MTIFPRKNEDKVQKFTIPNYISPKVILKVNFIIFLVVNSLLLMDQHPIIIASAFIYLFSSFYLLPFIVRNISGKSIVILKIIAIFIYLLIFYFQQFLLLGIGLIGFINGLIHSYIISNIVEREAKIKLVTAEKVQESILIVLNLILIVVIHKYFTLKSVFLLCGVNSLFILFLLNSIQSSIKTNELQKPNFSVYLITLSLFNAIFIQQYFYFLISSKSLITYKELFLLIIPISFLLITPLITGLMNHLRKGKREPSNNTKITLGLMSLVFGIGYLNKINFSIKSLIIFYIFLSISEILILSTVNVIMSKKDNFTSTSLLSNAIAGILAGIIGFLSYKIPNMLNHLVTLSLITLIYFSLSVKFRRGRS